MTKANRAAGFTSIEAAIAIAIAAIAIPALLVGFFQYATAAGESALRDRAVEIAASLVEEILSKAFEEPSLATGSFGREEASRDLFDDADDYDGYAAAPPVTSSGAAIAGAAALSAEVAIENVTAAAPDPVAAAPDGTTPYKRIRVRVAWTGGAVEVKALSARIDVPAATAGTGFVYVPGSRQDLGHKSFRFGVRNETGSDQVLTSLIAYYGPPATFYGRIDLRIVVNPNYGKVFEEKDSPGGRAGPAERAVFNQGEVVLVPAGAEFEITMRDFKLEEGGNGGGNADVTLVPFDVVLGTAAQDFAEFTVPVNG